MEHFESLGPIKRESLLRSHSSCMDTAAASLVASSLPIQPQTFSFRDSTLITLPCIPMKLHWKHQFEKFASDSICKMNSIGAKNESASLSS